MNLGPFAGAIEYGAGVTALNITGGTSGGTGVTFNINDTQAGTTTTITGGANQNFFNLSNAAESGGLDNLPVPCRSLAAPVQRMSSPSTTRTPTSTTLTPSLTTVSRIVFGGLTYDDNIGTLTLNAENTTHQATNGNNTININSTADFVTTNVNGQGGIDTINVNSTGTSACSMSVPVMTAARSTSSPTIEPVNLVWTGRTRSRTTSSTSARPAAPARWRASWARSTSSTLLPSTP